MIDIKFRIVLCRGLGVRRSIGAILESIRTILNGKMNVYRDRLVSWIFRHSLLGTWFRKLQLPVTDAGLPSRLMFGKPGLVKLHSTAGIVSNPINHQPRNISIH
ncbi:MAG: hypothetical protein ACREUQ_03440 [Burkholderiales bacterium]